MTQQPSRNLIRDRFHRSPAPLALGALALGIVLLFVCLALMAVPPHAEADLTNLTTSPQRVDVIAGNLGGLPSEGLWADQNGNAFAFSNLGQPRSAMLDMVPSFRQKTVVSDSILPVPNSPSAISTQGDPTLVPGWFSADLGENRSIAWGDVDGDGDLDLAAGSDNGSNKLYRNIGSVLQTQPTWISGDSDRTLSIAWGDVDGDGDLDLAAGNSGTANKVYLNVGGELSEVAVWSSSDSDYTYSVAWGDMDGDGDLDLAAGNVGPNKIYLNVDGSLQTHSSWTSADSGYTYSIAWGDMDGDGDLDLAAGNYGAPYGGASNKVYLNVGDTLQTQPGWTSADHDPTYSIAWGDVDGDADLDLAAGSIHDNKVYLNVGGTLQTQATWTSADSDYALSVAWGDVDDDGDLDLAVGNLHANKVYLNRDGFLDPQAAWLSADNDWTWSMAWGDIDGDGDLDLAAGNRGANKVYLNLSSVLQTQIAWASGDSAPTLSVAWGDVDGDGDLDLAVGNYGPNKMYTNVDGILQTQAAWTSNDSDNTLSVAWGDVDGDGDLDLAAGNSGSDKVYLNLKGMLQTQAEWASTDNDDTRSIAWGDVDGDGDLDLAVGNYGPDKMYLNVAGVLQTQADWVSGSNDSTYSIAWGDVDGDGDLDLAAGNDGPNRVYLNVGDVLQTQADWSSADSDDTRSLAWGDVDGDGDLDLATGNYDGRNKVYINVSGVLQTEADWASADNDETHSIAWGDMDGDGDLDLAAGNDDEEDPNKVYLNVHGVLQSQANWASGYCDFTSSVAWGDMDGDGDLDLAAGNLNHVSKVYLGGRPAHPSDSSAGPTIALDLVGAPVSTFNHASLALAPADFYSVPGIRGPGNIPISYTLYHPTSEPVRLVQAYFSPDGSLPRERRNWRLAVPTVDTDVTDLATSPYPTPTIASTHVYTWDVLASGFMGQSDNVIARVEALPNLKPLPNSVPGPFQRPYVSAQTYRFRVRGSQVRVTQDGEPIRGAMVYRLPAGQTGSYEAYRDRSDHPYHTNGSGYLQGYGEIGVGDRLVALVPITATKSYTLYDTSAPATPSGVDPYTVLVLGVQTLTVSSAHPLVLFNLDISLEWDARNDAPFLAQLNQDIRRASELLYDWSNGQAALGKVTVFHAKQHWQDAHVLIYANNRFRPAATEGGIITDTLTETVFIGATSVITYLPGQVAMGPVWNRYGDPGSNLGEDWPRAFAHELAHFALFLDDNYVGLDDHNLLVPVDTCPGAMADPYRDDDASGYGEFHLSAGWLPDCATTLSNRNTGRADWQTVGAFYPWLSTAITNPGPSVLPLAVTEVRVVEPITPTAALPAPLFLLVQNGNRVIPDSRARSTLFQDGWAIDLGQPSQDRLLARGAKPGDRLCVYDLGALRLGCETITAGDTELELVDKPTWQPEITITPLTTTTLTISVTHVQTSLALHARLYPLGEPSQSDIFLTEGSGGYSGTLHLDQPSLVGVIQVWVDEPGQRREIVTDYVLGGNPGRIWSGGGRIWSGGGRIWSGGGRIWSGGAPVSSADGQVTVYNADDSYSQEWFLTVQASSVEPPPWATLVGKAYRVSMTASAPSTQTMSIAFSYLGSDVPPGEEPWLRVYHREGTTWRQLSTRLDTTNNMASARLWGPGVYALMSSIEIPLRPDWDMFGYPILETRPVTEALISISGYYSTVHGYDPGAPDPYARWLTYDAQMPQQLDSLRTLEFGEGYWINVSQPITLLLKGGSQRLESAPDLHLPPATFFGTVTAGMGFTPTVGMPVTAWIEGRLCGRSRTQAVNGRIMVAVNVLSEGPGLATGCGVVGRPIAFRVDSTAITPGAVWNNTRTQQVTLRHCPDFDGNGGVDVLDIASIASRWGQPRGQAGWNEQFDWDGDGDVDVADIQQVAATWPRSCS